MKRIIAILVAALTLTMVVLTGCGLSSNTTETASSDTADTAVATDTSEVPAPSAVKGERDEEIYNFITAKSDNPDKIVIRFSSIDQNFEDFAEMRGEREFFRSLKERLGDRVEIQVFFNGTLGSTSDDIVGGLSAGSFEISAFSSGGYAEMTKAFNPLDVPYLFDSAEEAYELVCNGEMGDIMNEKCIEDTGIRILAYKQLGMRELTNNVREVKTVDDVKGLKLRVQMNNMFIKMVESWGAGATPVAYAELYTSLQQGVVDGQENPISLIYDSKFYEVQKYLTMTDHLSTFTVMACNEEWFQSLPEDVQEALIEAGKDCQEMTVESISLVEDEYMEFLRDNMQVYEPTEEELQTFKDAAKKMWPEAREYCGEEYFDKILKAAGKTLE